MWLLKFTVLEFAMYQLTLKRVLSRRTSDEKIQKQIEHILDRAFSAGRGRTWSATKIFETPRQIHNGNWLFTVKLTFTKERGQRDGGTEYQQWSNINAIILQSANSTAFQGNPWVVHDHTGGTLQGENPTTEPAPDNAPEDFTEIMSDTTKMITQMIGIRDIEKDLGPAKKWQELDVPDDLLGPQSDHHLSQNDAWKELYGVNPQIRILLSNIRRAKETNGESRNHAVLYGHSGCGKTTTLFCLERMFGKGSVLKLDATSTTKPGLEKLFFDELTEIPPLVFMEEAEKADPEALKIWLGALDDRGEIHKINFKVNKLRAIKVLFICTVNDKRVFDKMMGSDGSEAGALSSRCVTQIYYPRPSSQILTQILSKEIEAHGGRQEWIPKAIEMAEEMGVTDPRIVRSYLAGGDRLIDGTYQRDWKAVFESQRNFNKKV